MYVQNPDKFWGPWDQMYVQNPGEFIGWTNVYVKIQGFSGWLINCYDQKLKYISRN